MELKIKTQVFAILRVDPDLQEIADQVTVKGIVLTEEEAIAEVDRLNGLRKGESYYNWQATRLLVSDSARE